MSEIKSDPELLRAVAAAITIAEALIRLIKSARCTKLTDAEKQAVENALNRKTNEEPNGRY